MFITSSLLAVLTSLLAMVFDEDMLAIVPFFSIQELWELIDL